MSTLQFIASLVSSLAWPLVAAWALFLLRSRLTDLIPRLRELHLPGTKAIFDAGLDVGHEARQQLERQGPIKIAPSTDSPTLPSDPKSLVGSVFIGYRQVLELVSEAREAMGMPPNYGPKWVLTVLRSNGAISDEVVTLYEALTRSRNALAHGKLENLTPEEAQEFSKQVEAFSEIMQAVVANQKSQKRV